MAELLRGAWFSSSFMRIIQTELFDNRSLLSAPSRGSEGEVLSRYSSRTEKKSEKGSEGGF